MKVKVESEKVGLKLNIQKMISSLELPRGNKRWIDSRIRNNEECGKEMNHRSSVTIFSLGSEMIYIWKNVVQ